MRSMHAAAHGLRAERVLCRSGVCCRAVQRPKHTCRMHQNPGQDQLLSGVLRPRCPGSALPKTRRHIALYGLTIMARVNMKNRRGRAGTATFGIDGQWWATALGAVCLRRFKAIAVLRAIFAARILGELLQVPYCPSLSLLYRAAVNSADYGISQRRARHGIACKMKWASLGFSGFGHPCCGPNMPLISASHYRRTSHRFKRVIARNFGLYMIGILHQVGLKYNERRTDHPQRFQIKSGSKAIGTLKYIGTYMFWPEVR
jgi:hypothetical protein